MIRAILIFFTFLLLATLSSIAQSKSSLLEENKQERISGKPGSINISDVKVAPEKLESRKGENSNRGIGDMKLSRTFEVDHRAVASDRWTADTVYFTDVRRRFDWIEGSGRRLSSTQARHAPLCYRLTMKNLSGHFLHVESLSYGKAVPSEALGRYLLKGDKASAYIEPTLLPLVDRNAIVQAADSVASVRVVPSIDGKRVQIEYADNADGRLLYQFNIERIREKRSVVSYLDASGNGFDITPGLALKCYIPGTQVVVDYKENGDIDNIQLVDGKGWLLYNISEKGEEDAQ